MKRTPRSPAAALAVLLTGVFMAVLDTFVVLVAAPAIQRDLRASDADVQLVLAGYQLTYAVALITGARLGDLLGRRRMFLTGMAVFTLASAACAAAPGAGALIAARLVQGLGAAVMFPQVFSLIQVLVPAERRPRALGALGAVIGAAGVAGQLLGGLLVAADLFGTSWRPVFWVNVPVGLAALVLAAAYVPESRAPEAGRRPDLPGAAVLTVALSLLVVPLVEGRERGWPLWTWLSLCAAAGAFACFAAVERRARTPLLRPGLLHERPFAVGIVLVLLVYSGVNSFFLVLSLTVQDGLGMGTLGAGLVYLPFAAAFFAGSVAAGRLARHGRRLLSYGALVSALGHAAGIATVLLAGAALSPWQLAAALTLVGAGNGLLVTPLIGTVLSRVAPAEAGMASGVLSTGQQVGGAVGVAVVGVLCYGTLGGAGRGDAMAYGHGLIAASVFDGVLCVVVSALLPLLRERPAIAPRAT
ncbi:MFS transporter [Streptomyces sp. AV19]|uniref:MFS transporter n=1 Tax=Streptomyces sp. AV19 TaxID=2793068 RepID=UPI001F26C30C|nr:MFS transporter [Streptomyces sp. AV19]MDG4535963.1 MFS transporter [Streptomyces sp. AV19]